MYKKEMEYDGDGEDHATSDLFKRFPEVRKLLGAKHKAFLYELQNIHDCYEPIEWKRELTSFAHEHKLEVPS